MRREADLVGIEPTTSSMPWKSQNSILLTAKALKDGRVGKDRQNRPVLLPKCYQNECYQFATKHIDLGQGLTAGDRPFFHFRDCTA